MKIFKRKKRKISLIRKQLGPRTTDVLERAFLLPLNAWPIFFHPSLSKSQQRFGAEEKDEPEAGLTYAKKGT